MSQAPNGRNRLEQKKKQACQNEFNTGALWRALSAPRSSRHTSPSIKKWVFPNTPTAIYFEARVRKTPNSHPPRSFQLVGTDQVPAHRDCTGLPCVIFESLSLQQ
eukprot:1143245-Pelagomonas_calceolata.AAC.12